jgi:RHS repeat-associated protein
MFRDGVGDTVFYVYGDSLHLTEVRDAKGQQYRSVFNRAGFIDQRIDPVGKQDRYFYNAEGLATTRVNRRGDTIATAFDALHRATSLTAPGAEARSFAFDSVGRVAVGSNSVAVDSIFVDTLTGWTEAVVTRYGTDPSKRFRVFYRPDSAHRLDSLGISSSGTAVSFVARRYVWNDTTGRLASIKLDGTTAASFGYNGELLRSTTALPNVTRSDDHTTIHGAYQAGFSTLEVDTLLWRSFRFDTVGRIVAMHAPIENAVNRVQFTYQYDAAGRLTGVSDTAWAYEGACPGTPDADYGSRLCTQGTPTHVWTHTYGYDSVGNITNVAGFTESGSATYNTGNRIATWPGYSFVHDSAGNLIQRTKTSSGEVTAFTWDALGHLRKVAVGGDTSYYDYNAFGQLVRKRKHGGVTTSHMLWASDHLVAEFDGALTKRKAEYAYYPGTDAPLAVITGDTLPTLTRYYQQDALGNVSGLVNSDGTVAQNNDISDGWGLWGNLPTESSRLGWKGLLYEEDRTQLYYVRARWFDPLTKRFISEDPLGIDAGINPYVFAGNDPVNGRDPSGLLWIWCGVRDGEIRWCIDMEAGGEPFDVDFDLGDFLSGAVSFDGMVDAVTRGRDQSFNIFDKGCESFGFSAGCSAVTGAFSTLERKGGFCAQMGRQGRARWDARGYVFDPYEQAQGRAYHLGSVYLPVLGVISLHLTTLGPRFFTTTPEWQAVIVGEEEAHHHRPGMGEPRTHAMVYPACFD